MGANDDSLKAFDVDLKKFADKLGIAIQIVMIRITLDLFRRITKRTPVDTGRARASWDVKQGTPSSFVPPERKKSVAGKGKTRLGTGLGGEKLGTGALSGGKAKDVSSEIADIDGTKVVFITTNLDYMVYLEQGSSKQAPAGMVLLSIAEIEIEIENILDQL